MSESPTIYQAINAVVEEMGAIGKTGRNKEQGYNFRGIDAVLIELHPLFAKHGIFFAPTVIERLYEERLSKQGNIGHCCHLHVAYKVYGPSGDFVELSTWGEGLDYSDKATNKAMTAAFKYAMFELFAICDPSEDADGTTEDGGQDTEQKKREYTPTGQSHQSDGDLYVHGGGNADFDVILEAAVLESNNDFMQSLATQIRVKGRLTDNQISSGVPKAHKIVTG